MKKREKPWTILSGPTVSRMRPIPRDDKTRWKAIHFMFLNLFFKVCVYYCFILHSQHTAIQHNKQIRYHGEEHSRAHCIVSAAERQRVITHSPKWALLSEGVISSSTLGPNQKGFFSFKDRKAHWINTQITELLTDADAFSLLRMS